MYTQVLMTIFIASGLVQNIKKSARVCMMSDNNPFANFSRALEKGCYDGKAKIFIRLIIGSVMNKKGEESFHKTPDKKPAGFNGSDFPQLFLWDFFPLPAQTMMPAFRIMHYWDPKAVILTQKKIF